MKISTIFPDNLVRWFLNDRAVRRQVDYILPFIYLSLTVSAFLLFRANEIVSAKDLFLTLFSCFASIMMLIAWQHSKDTGEKKYRGVDCTTSDLTLYFFTWAIIIWQMETVLNTPLLIKYPGQRKLVSALFSSLNNIFLLWAALDFEYVRNPSWMRVPILNQLRSGRRILFAGLIIMSAAIIIFFANKTTLNGAITGSPVRWFLLPDVIFSALTSYILCEGLIQILSFRFLNALDKNDKLRTTKNWVLIVSISLVFVITMIGQVFHLWPALVEYALPIFYSSLPESKDALETYGKNLLAINSLSYRTLLTMLFFMLEISWINMMQTQTNRSLLDELERNRSLKNEISHRTKNHLNTLAAIISRQLEKESVQASPLTVNELSATLGRVYTTALVHELLDNKKGDDVNNVSLSDYLTKICAHLEALFAFPPGNFIYHIDINTLFFETPYAEARHVGSVLTDLLINVNQHAYTLDEQKWVKIEFKGQKEHFILRISDRGKGLNGQEGKPVGSQSTGRGLLIVRNIVERQFFGSITTKRRAGGGVTFEVIIPMKMLMTPNQNIS